MHRTGRIVTGRARVTRYGALTSKLCKNALCGVADRSKRKTITPRALKNRLESFRRGLSAVDICAFSHAIRGAAFCRPLFHKAGVMRYDPLKKNVVRPFRALFGFIFGVVRGLVHSAITFGASPLIPVTRLLAQRSRKGVLRASYKRTASVEPYLRKTISSHPLPALQSHPLQCFKRRASVHPLSTTDRQGDLVEKSKEIAQVLKAYNTSSSRDRLINKLENMKSSAAAKCIKSLSHRQQGSLSNRELLHCRQEMLQLSKQLSGVATERSVQPNSAFTRSLSVMEHRPIAVAGETLRRTMTPAPERSTVAASLESLKRSIMSERSSKHQPITESSHTASIESLTSKVKAVTKRKEVETKPRSERLRMKLKEHEHMVHNLKSRYAALNHPRGMEGRAA